MNDQSLTEMWINKIIEEKTAELRQQIERLEREAAAGRVLAVEILATNVELMASDGIAFVKPVHRASARMAFALVAYDKAVGDEQK